MLQLARALTPPSHRPKPPTSPPPSGHRPGAGGLDAGSPVDGRVLGDAELVGAALAGREEALGELFRRHHGAAVGVARRCLADRADAEDAVSEAFTRAFERLGSLRSPERFRAFLLAIVRSVASDRHRHARRARPHDDLDLRPAAGDVEGAVLSGEASRALVAAVADLPARQRYAVHRFYWDEVPVATLAGELGVSVNATTQLLFRARASLALRTGESCRRPGARSAR